MREDADGVLGMGLRGGQPLRGPRAAGPPGVILRLLFFVPCSLFVARQSFGGGSALPPGVPASWHLWPGPWCILHTIYH